MIRGNFLPFEPDRGNAREGKKRMFCVVKNQIANDCSFCRYKEKKIRRYR
jgi:hypothetical protein